MSTPHGCYETQEQKTMRRQKENSAALMEESMREKKATQFASQRSNSSLDSASETTRVVQSLSKEALDALDETVDIYIANEVSGGSAGGGSCMLDLKHQSNLSGSNASKQYSSTSDEDPALSSPRQRQGESSSGRSNTSGASTRTDESAAAAPAGGDSPNEESSSSSQADAAHMRNAYPTEKTSANSKRRRKTTVSTSEKHNKRPKVLRTKAPPAHSNSSGLTNNGSSGTSESSEEDAVSDGSPNDAEPRIYDWAGLLKKRPRNIHDREEIKKWLLEVLYVSNAQQDEPLKVNCSGGESSDMSSSSNSGSSSSELDRTDLQSNSSSSSVRTDTNPADDPTRSEDGSSMEDGETERWNNSDDDRKPAATATNKMQR